MIDGLFPFSLGHLLLSLEAKGQNMRVELDAELVCARRYLHGLFCCLPRVFMAFKWIFHIMRGRMNFL